MTIAAVVTLPIAVPQLPRIDGADWWLFTFSAVIGVAIPFSVDTIAGRITSARIIGVLFAVDPALSSLVGFVLLGQAMSPQAIAGIGLVAVAGALIVWFAKQPNPVGAHPLPPE